MPRARKGRGGGRTNTHVVLQPTAKGGKRAVGPRRAFAHNRSKSEMPGYNGSSQRPSKTNGSAANGGAKNGKNGVPSSVNTMRRHLAPPATKANTRRKRKGSKSKSRCSINVCVRVRPLRPHEAKDQVILNIKNERVVTLIDPKYASDPNKPLSRSRNACFAFDVALNQKHSTKHLYETSVRGVVDAVMQGKHGTVFAYGATGSGKTFTMSGTEDNPGVMYHTIHDLFAEIHSQKHRVHVTASYLEIYNETLRDLLCTQDTPIELREDRDNGVSVAGITEYPMKDAHDVFSILKRGSARRTIDSHNLNAASSRSHAVFWIVVEQFEHEDIGDPSATKTANLTMIDLAGSERAKKTGTNKKMLREGAKINRSLLALANCINALGQSRKKGLYVPYRDSKLTRLLKESLSGGTAQTVMICNVSPASSQFDETRETLLYANRAKNIKVTPAMRSQPARKTTAELEKLVNSLRSQLAQVKATLIPNRRVSMSLQSVPNMTREAPEESSDDETPEDDSSVSESPRVFSRNSSRLSVLSPMSSVPSSGLSQGRLARQVSAAEIRTMNTLATEIVDNFRDRLQLRRTLVELAEQAQENKERMKEFDQIIQTYGQHGNSVQFSRALRHKKGLMEASKANEEYRKNQLKQLAQLEKEGMQLVESVGAKQMKAERQRVLHLTVERCALELQNLELELRERSLQREVEDRNYQLQYYMGLLQKHGINFTRYEKLGFSAQRRIARKSTSYDSILSSDVSSVKASESKESLVAAARIEPQSPTHPPPDAYFPFQGLDTPRTSQDSRGARASQDSRGSLRGSDTMPLPRSSPKSVRFAWPALADDNTVMLPPTPTSSAATTDSIQRVSLLRRQTSQPDLRNVEAEQRRLTKPELRRSNTLSSARMKASLLRAESSALLQKLHTALAKRPRGKNGRPSDSPPSYYPPHIMVSSPSKKDEHAHQPPPLKVAPSPPVDPSPVSSAGVTTPSPTPAAPSPSSVELPTNAGRQSRLPPAGFRPTLEKAASEQVYRPKPRHVHRGQLVPSHNRTASLNPDLLGPAVAWRISARRVSDAVEYQQRVDFKEYSRAQAPRRGSSTDVQRLASMVSAMTKIRTGADVQDLEEVSSCSDGDSSSSSDYDEEHINFMAELSANSAPPFWS